MVGCLLNQKVGATEPNATRKVRSTRCGERGWRWSCAQVATVL